MNAHSLSEFTRTNNTYLTMPYFQKSQNNTHGLIEAHVLIIFNENIFQNKLCKTTGLVSHGMDPHYFFICVFSQRFCALYRSG